jgi:hypothetical protein
MAQKFGELIVKMEESLMPKEDYDRFLNLVKQRRTIRKSAAGRVY